MNHQPCFEFNIFARDMGLHSFRAAQPNGEISASKELKQITSMNCLDYIINETMNEMIKETILQGASQRKLYHLNDPRQVIAIGKRDGFFEHISNKSTILKTAQIRLKISDFGISKTNEKIQIQRLKNAHTELLTSDWNYYEGIKKNMIDRAGQFVHWFYGENDCYTEAFILIEEAERILFSIDCCKKFENAFNKALSTLSNGKNWSITIPAMDPHIFTNAKLQYLAGKITTEQMREIIFPNA